MVRKRRKRGTASNVSRRKARKILRHGSVRGKKLTAKQKRLFGWIAGGRKRRRKKRRHK